MAEVSAPVSAHIIIASREYGNVVKRHDSKGNDSLTLGEGHYAESGPLHFTTLAPWPISTREERQQWWLWCFPAVRTGRKGRSRSLSFGPGECPDHPDTDRAFTVRLIKENA